MPVTEEFTVISSLPNVDIPDVTFHDFVLPVAANFKDKTCEIDALTGRQETFGSVLDKSLCIANFLQKNGLGPGDTVAIHCGSVIEYTQVAFGILRAGCTVLNIRGGTVRELRAIVENAKPVYVFTEAKKAAKVLEAVRDLIFCECVVSFSEAFGCVSLCNVVETNGRDFIKPNLNPDETVALISYSNGTTGSPKGVQLTHRNLVACTLLQSIFPTEKSRILLYFKPVLLGGSLLRLCNLYNGGYGVILPSFEVSSVLHAIQQYKITQIALTPSSISELVNSSIGQFGLSSVEAVTFAGGSIPISVLEKLKNMLKCKSFFPTYGQTEAVSCFYPSNELDSIGVIAGNVQAKAVHIETGKAQPAGQIGELCLKGPTVMKGYLNDPEAAKKAIDDEGWLHSEDLVYYDDQERFFFIGTTEMIMSCSGSKVSPFELEQILTSHPSVAEAVVIAVLHGKFGEVPRAYVVLNEPCEDDLVAFVDKQVADYKRLTGGLKVVDNLPKSFTGKYLRREIQETYFNELRRSNLA